MFDLAQLMDNEIRISKIEVARRQLESFIEMFFTGKDVVSQHTLVMAAHTVLFDISKKRGIGGSLGDPQGVTAEEKTHAINSFRLPQNFFKHADHDADGSQRFFPSVSHFMAMDAARLYVLLGGDTTRIINIFFMWFQLQYPDIFKFEPVEAELKEIRSRIANSCALKEFACTLIGQQ